jgi:hypothetical protein
MLPISGLFNHMGRGVLLGHDVLVGRSALLGHGMLFVRARHAVPFCGRSHALCLLQSRALN